MNSVTAFVEQINEEVNSEEAPENKPKAKLDPCLMVGIITSILAITEDDKSNLNEVIYLTVKKFIFNRMKGQDPKVVANSFFIYYLETFRIYYILHTEKLDETFDRTKVERGPIYNDAVLYIFDLYLKRPNDGFIRRILNLSVSLLYEIIAEKIYAKDPKTISNKTNGSLFSLALIGKTLKEYTKGIWKYKNFEYIRWVRTIFKELLESDDLTAFDNNQIVKQVLTDISNTKKIIKIQR